jgi:hypothetical protein
MGNSALVADDYRRLEEIQEELVRAWLTHDRSILDRLLAPEWMVTQADGRTSTREGVMLEFDSGGNRLLEGNVDDIKVRVFENCAIVTGCTYARGEYKSSLRSQVAIHGFVCATRRGVAGGGVACLQDSGDVRSVWVSLQLTIM